jgi:hypothetical protein
VKILLEEYKYPVELVKKVLCGIGVDTLQDVEGDVSLSYVGYFYNPELKDCVFILPKVLMNESGKVFGRYSPTALLDIDGENSPLTDKERKFLYEFAVWIYRAVTVFRDSHKGSDIVCHNHVLQVGHGTRRRTNTLLDILLSLIQFGKDHQDFITFTVKNIHSGLNKINWTRTINRSQAIVQDGTPIYLNPVNKKRQVNFDEELLVIFYSILNYISEKYGFRVNINVGFELIKGAKFESYIKGRGCLRLRQIKYKYFSDIALEMWGLCYAFFDKSQSITTSATLEEYLLVKNFYVVFEAMIDELIGSATDKNMLPKELTEQKDGKLVDHLYTYKGLMQPEGEEAQTYYIGDSKYYKIGGHLGENSIYKQYTYARNIVQYNIDLWLDDAKPNPDIKVRDEQTEGYNILPNFFISAAMEKDDFSYGHREIVPTDEKRTTEIKYQFEDRLFDRDTMLLSRYNVNFLFVVALYARNNYGEKKKWRDEVRERFREEIQKVLAEHYNFYPMRSKGVNVEEYVKTHFRQLIGKVFTPFEDKEILTLALQTPADYANEEVRVRLKAEHAELMAMLEKDFTIQKDYQLGAQPQLPPKAVVEYGVVDAPRNGVLMVMLENYDTRCVKFLEKGILAVGIKSTKDSMRIVENRANIGYILFHIRKDEGQHLFAVEDVSEIKYKTELGDAYPNITTADMYVVVTLKVDELNCDNVHSSKKEFDGKSERYDSQYATMEELMD